MRRALGLGGESSPQPVSQATPLPTAGMHPQRRRFVRDGEVVVQHRDHSAPGDTGTNQLAAARQALREQIAAREELERSLAEAQAANRDLQTKLAHERLAKDEALNRAEAARLAIEQALQAAEADLASERALRLELERRLAGARERPRDVPAMAALAEPAPPRRRGRPPKVRPAEAEPEPQATEQADFVEWWVPGWNKRFR
jgi:hypothetical protein